MKRGKERLVNRAGELIREDLGAVGDAVRLQPGLT